MTERDLYLSQLHAIAKLDSKYVYFRFEVETGWCKLRIGTANIEGDQGPLAAVLELCDEAWMYSMLSEHPNQARPEPNRR